MKEMEYETLRFVKKDQKREHVFHVIKVYAQRYR